MSERKQIMVSIDRAWQRDRNSMWRHMLGLLAKPKGERKNKMKYCKDCKHWRMPPIEMYAHEVSIEAAQQGLSLCASPKLFGKNSTEIEPSPVTGKSIGRSAVLARQMACGPEGKLWEAKFY